MRDPAPGLTSSRRPGRASQKEEMRGDALSRTGERARVARDQLARAHEHLEQARKRLQRTKDRDRGSW